MNKLIIASLAAAISGAAFAGTDSTADVNAEMKAAVEKTEAAVEAVEQSTFSQLDADNSGTLTINEVEAISDIKASYETIDVNANGEIDAAEFAQFEEESAAQ